MQITIKYKIAKMFAEVIISFYAFVVVTLFNAE